VIGNFARRTKHAQAAKKKGAGKGARSKGSGKGQWVFVPLGNAQGSKQKAKGSKPKVQKELSEKRQQKRQEFLDRIRQKKEDRKAEKETATA